jgi:hypothetical protein
LELLRFINSQNAKPSARSLVRSQYQLLSSYVLAQAVQVVLRTSVYSLSTEDQNSNVVSEKKQQYETRLAKALGLQVPQMDRMHFDDNKIDKDSYVKYADDDYELTNTNLACDIVLRCRKVLKGLNFVQRFFY